MSIKKNTNNQHKNQLNNVAEKLINWFISTLTKISNNPKKYLPILIIGVLLSYARKLRMGGFFLLIVVCSVLYAGCHYGYIDITKIMNYFNI